MSNRLIISIIIFAALLSSPTVLSNEDDQTNLGDQPSIEERVANRISASGIRKFETYNPKEGIPGRDSQNLESSISSDIEETFKINLQRGFENSSADIAVILLFATPILIVTIIVYGSYRRRKLLLDTFNSIVTSGNEVPEAMYEFARKRESNNRCHNGIILVSLGIGIIFSFYGLLGYQYAKIGLIPIFVGLGNFVIAFSQGASSE